MNVPLLDLQAQYAYLEKDILKAVSDVLRSQRCIGGPVVEALEQSVAEASDCKYAVGASSGTDAILNVLMSLGIGEGDEVITSPFTFFATVGCIVRCGAKPVFVDINPDTFNIDTSKIEAVITKKTKAIMPVHLFGQMVDMDPLMEIATENKLYVIEDSAQSITSTYKQKKSGSIGTAGCFSFFPSKNLGGVGDGGMVVTNDKKLYDQLIIMRNHGSKPKYYHKFVGGNFRLDPIQAAALMVKLPHLDSWSQQRRENALYYDNAFKDSAVITPTIHTDCVSIYNQYCIQSENRDGLITHLQEKTIGCEIYYPVPMHMQECFANLGYQAGDFPVAEKVSNEIMALPIYPELTEAHLDYVIKSVKQFTT